MRDTWCVSSNHIDYPRSIKNLIEQFSKLPTVGPKTAERYVFYLLKRSADELKNFGSALSGLKDGIYACQSCYSLTDSPICPVCRDTKRRQNILCVVAESRDMATIESTKQYNGLYFVLGGVLDAIEGVKPESINIEALTQKIKNSPIEEVILALNPNMEGETTSLYLARLVKSLNSRIKITRLAKGLPMGADLEYADEITLTNALKYRNEIK